MFYLIKTPWFLKKIYPDFIWDVPSKEKIIYLSFDDGPHKIATTFILDQLKKYDAKGTFFCLGKNVVQFPQIYLKTLEEGHRIGNHTFNHLNGWKTDDKVYIKDIADAKQIIDSNLFRPPYGRVTKFQAKLLMKNKDDVDKNKNIQTHSFDFKIIMWSVLSGDFDERLSPEKCLQNVLLNAKSGSIVVFHDSAKAFERLRYALPKTLEYFSKKGYLFKAIV